MKKWTIPAKTFLLGEYAAISGLPAMMLTTAPCFELILTDRIGLHDIHPESPAGRWWLKNGSADVGVQWHDPYQGCGGLGASSAQFLGAYLASMYLQNKTVIQQAMLEAYLQYAWQGEGVSPSGYDVLAQSQRGCVFIDRQNGACKSMPWPFQNVAFLLLHTGQKLATHHHLQEITLPNHLNQLAAIVNMAKLAFEQVDSQRIVDAVNAYHHQLLQMNLVAKHSLQYIELLRNQPGLLAVKGCGAMGADVLLLLVTTNHQIALHQFLSEQGWKILASSKDLYIGAPLIQNTF